VGDSTIVVAIVAEKNVPQFIKAVDKLGDACQLRFVIQMENLKEEITHSRLKLFSLSDVIKMV